MDARGVLIHRGFIVGCYAGLTDHRGARVYCRTEQAQRREGAGEGRATTRGGEDVKTAPGRNQERDRDRFSEGEAVV
jgi:hypothetical protein